MKSRRCCKCEIEKPIYDFYKTKTECKECLRQNRQKPMPRFSKISLKDENDKFYNRGDFGLCVESCRNLIEPFDWITAVFFQEKWFEISRIKNKKTAGDIHGDVKDELRKNQDKISIPFIDHIRNIIEEKYFKQGLLF